jgi:predicted lactoylglutathione lyase
MASRIFINLPVKDINASMRFFSQIGFEFDQRFSSPDTLCMVVSEHIYVMLLEQARFKTFTKKPISDAHTHTEVLIALDADSREGVDDMVRKALEAGGALYAEPIDHGFMYSHSFEDLDGHQWEIGYMDMSQIPY